MEMTQDFRRVARQLERQWQWISREDPFPSTPLPCSSSLSSHSIFLLDVAYCWRPCMSGRPRSFRCKLRNGIGGWVCSHSQDEETLLSPTDLPMFGLCLSHIHVLSGASSAPVPTGFIHGPLPRSSRVPQWCLKRHFPSSTPLTVGGFSMGKFGVRICPGRTGL